MRLQAGIRRVGLAAGLALAAGAASAQNGPQNNWVVEDTRGWPIGGGSVAGAAASDQEVFVVDCSAHCVKVFGASGGLARTWGSGGSGDGNYNGPRGIAWDGSNLFVADTGNHRIVVVDTNGVFVRKWGTGGSADGQFNAPWGLAVDTQNVFVADTSNHRIQVFTKTGQFVRKWGRSGSVAGEFGLPSGIAVDRQAVYVADRNNYRIQVFTKEGKFLRSWSKTDENNAPSNQPLGIAVDDDSVYACFGYPSYMSGWTARVAVYDKYGSLRWTCAYYYTYEGQLAQSGPSVLRNPRGIALRNPYVYVADESLGVAVLHRIHRTLGTLVPSPIPLAEVLSCRQREGTSILDVDYAADDSSEATVTAYAGAFVSTNAVLRLDDFVPMRTFVDGTGTNMGPGIATGVVRRLSWDMVADGVSAKLPQYGNVRVSVMVKDSHGLLDFHFLHIPAIGTNAAFTIDRTPLRGSDLLPLWFWFLAAGDASVRLSGGQVLGVGGAYDGLTLAQGTNTTAEGRAFLFERLNVREATANELRLAREASTPGQVAQWTPRRDPPPAGSKVNAFNFVTSPTNGWWVVPLTP